VCMARGSATCRCGRRASVEVLAKNGWTAFSFSLSLSLSLSLSRALSACSVTYYYNLLL
jgi:hypothetical protein